MRIGNVSRARLQLFALALLAALVSCCVPALAFAGDEGAALTTSPMSAQGQGSLEAQAEAASAKTISPGYITYETFETNHFQFTPKVTGTYRFEDYNADAAKSYASRYDTYTSSSDVTIYRGSDENPLYATYFGYNDAKDSYKDYFECRLEAGKTYRITWQSNLSTGYWSSATFSFGRILDKGKTFTAKVGFKHKGDVKYKVTNTKPLEVQIIRAKKSDAVYDTVTYEGVRYAITSVAAKAFKGNKRISDFVNGNVTSIGSKAFYGCTKLHYCPIQENIRKIGASAFAKCKNLRYIDVHYNPYLTKKSVRNCLKGSSVKLVCAGDYTAKNNKKFIKRCKKLFKKSNCGKKVKVRAGGRGISLDEIR